MIVYIPVGSGPTRDKYLATGRCGLISNRIRFGVPGQGRTPECRWVQDNGAFDDWKNNKPFDYVQFLKRIETILHLNPCRRPEWCVVPDRVADPTSLSYSVRWRKYLPDQLCWFLAVQDGMIPAVVESAMTTSRFEGIAVGGSDDFKNRTACEWVRFAHGLGLPCHILRVNYWKRLQWAIDIGADSIDGTGWTRNPSWVKYVENLQEPTPMLWSA